MRPSLPAFLVFPVPAGKGLSLYVMELMIQFAHHAQLDSSALVALPSANHAKVGNFARLAHPLRDLV